MPRIRPIGHKNRTKMPDKRGRSIELGPLTTIAEIEDGLRFTAKLMSHEGDLVGASRNMMALASIKFRAKELEYKGLNVRSEEGEQITLTLNDYRQPYLDQLDENKRLGEEVAALKGQLATMQGKDRPRPPRPPLN